MAEELELLLLPVIVEASSDCVFGPCRASGTHRMMLEFVGVGSLSLFDVGDGYTKGEKKKKVFNDARPWPRDKESSSDCSSFTMASDPSFSQ